MAGERQSTQNFVVMSLSRRLAVVVPIAGATLMVGGVGSYAAMTAHRPVLKSVCVDVKSHALSAPVTGRCARGKISEALPSPGQGSRGPAGAPGAAGPSGPSGAPGATSVSRVNKTDSAPANAADAIDVFCPTGATAVGGGYSYEGQTGFTIYVDRPTSNPVQDQTGWQIGALNSSDAAVNFTAYALCAAP